MISGSIQGIFKSNELEKKQSLKPEKKTGYIDQKNGQANIIKNDKLIQQIKKKNSLLNKENSQQLKNSSSKKSSSSSNLSSVSKSSSSSSSQSQSSLNSSSLSDSSSISGSDSENSSKESEVFFSNDMKIQKYGENAKQNKFQLSKNKKQKVSQTNNQDKKNKSNNFSHYSEIDNEIERVDKFESISYNQNQSNLIRSQLEEFVHNQQNFIQKEKDTQIYESQDSQQESDESGNQEKIAKDKNKNIEETQKEDNFQVKVMKFQINLPRNKRAVYENKGFYEREVIEALDGQEKIKHYMEIKFLQNEFFFKESRKYEILEEQLFENFKQEDFRKKVAEYSIDLEKEILSYDMGICNLGDFIKMRQKKMIKWKKSELIYVFHQLLSFVVLLNKSDLYHSNIKPSNIIIAEKNGKNFRKKQGNQENLSKSRNQMKQSIFQKIESGIQRQRSKNEKEREKQQNNIEEINKNYSQENLEKNKKIIKSKRNLKGNNKTLSLSKKISNSQKGEKKNKSEDLKNEEQQIDQEFKRIYHEQNEMLKEENKENQIQKTLKLMEKLGLEKSVMVGAEELQKKEELKQRQIDLKLLFSDFSCLSKFEKGMVQNMCTPLYFDSYKRTENRKHRYFSKDERFRAEVYMVTRVFMEVLLGGNLCQNLKVQQELEELFDFQWYLDERVNKGGKSQKKFQTFERLQKFMNVIKNRIYKVFYQKANDFKLMIDFICDVIIPENYQGSSQIIKFLQNEEIFPKNVEETFIQDIDNSVFEIIEEKQKNYDLIGDFQDENFIQQNMQAILSPLDKFFDMKYYVSSQVGQIIEPGQIKNKQKICGVDLISKCSEFLQQDQQNEVQKQQQEKYQQQQYLQQQQIQQYYQEKQKQKRFLIILGEEGSGKSCLLEYLGHKFCQRGDIYSLNLATFRSQKELEQKVYKIYLKYQHNVSEKLFFLLDGYDKLTLNLFKAKIDISQVFNLQKFQNVKIILTCKKNFLDIFSLRETFKFCRDMNNYEIYYLDRWKDQDIYQFFSKIYKDFQSLGLVGKQNKSSLNQNYLKKQQDYIDFFTENEQLMEFSRNPLNFRVLFQILPFLQEQEEKLIEEYFVGFGEKFSVKQKKLQNNAMKNKYMIKQYIYSEFNIYEQYIIKYVQRQIQSKLDIETIDFFLEQNNYGTIIPLNKQAYAQKIDFMSEIVIACGQEISLYLYLNQTKVIDSQKIFYKEIKQKFGISIGELYFDEEEQIQKLLECLPIQVCYYKQRFQQRKQKKNLNKNQVKNEQNKQDLEKIEEKDENLEESCQENQEEWYFKGQNQEDDLSQEKYMFIFEKLQQNFLAQAFILDLGFQLDLILENDENFSLDLEKIQASILNRANFQREQLFLQYLIQYVRFMYPSCDLFAIYLKQVLEIVRKQEEGFGRELNLLVSNICTILSILEFQFDGIDFSQAHLSFAQFRYNRFYQCNFYNCNLQHTQFIECQITDCNFNRTVMEYTDFGVKDEIIEAHNNIIHIVRYSPKGKYIASACEDGKIIIWENESKQKFKQLFGHKGGIFSLDFMEKYDILASGGQDMLIILWNYLTGQVVKKLEGHQNWIKCVQFSPDSQRIFSGGMDCCLKSWDIQDIYTDQELQFNKNKNYLFKNQDKKLKFKQRNQFQSNYQEELMDQNQEGKVISRKLIHENTIIQIKISNNMDYVATCGENKFIKLWNYQDLKLARNIRGHEASVTCIDFSKDNKFLISGNEKGDILVFRVLDKMEAERVKIQSNQRDKQDLDWVVFAVGVGVGVGAGIGAGVGVGVGHQDFIREIRFSRQNNQYFASCDGRGKIILWDFKSQTNFGRNVQESQDNISSIDFSKDGRYIVSSGFDQKIRFHQVLEDFQIKEEIQYDKELHNQKYVCFTFKDKFQIAIGSEEGYVLIFSLVSLKILENSFKAHQKAISCIQYYNEGQNLVTGSVDNSIKIWKQGQKSAFLEISGHQGIVNSIFLSCDERFLLSASEDCSAKIWNLMSGKSIKTLGGHVYGINQAIYSDDNKYIATCSKDNTVRLIDVNNNYKAIILNGHSRSVNCAKFSSDNMKILTGSDDRTFKLWRVDNGKQIYSILDSLCGEIFWVQFLNFGQSQFDIFEQENLQKREEIREIKKNQEKQKDQSRQIDEKNNDNSQKSENKIQDMELSLGSLNFSSQYQKQKDKKKIEKEAIIYAGKEGGIYIWDQKDWSLIQSMEIQSNRLKNLGEFKKVLGSNQQLENNNIKNKISKLNCTQISSDNEIIVNIVEGNQIQIYRRKGEEERKKDEKIKEELLCEKLVKNGKLENNTNLNENGDNYKFNCEKLKKLEQLSDLYYYDKGYQDVGFFLADNCFEGSLQKIQQVQTIKNKQKITKIDVEKVEGKKVYLYM